MIPSESSSLLVEVPAKAQF